MATYYHTFADYAMRKDIIAAQIDEGTHDDE